MMKATQPLLALLFVMASASPWSAAAAQNGVAVGNWEQACAALVGPTYPADDGVAKVTETKIVAAGGGKPSAEQMQVYATRGKVQAVPTQAIESLPAHCLVSGYATPNIRFELRLPAQEWNRRMLMVACDGFCGFVFSEACVPGLMRDYATVTSDGGHTATRNFDGAWGYDNRQAEIDFGYRANHVVAVAAKAILARFYGEPPRHSYLTGCSKGGSAGVMAATRYPADFDGIIAGAPVLDYQRKNAIHFPWVAKAMQAADDSFLLSPEQLPAIEAAVLRACDAIDGQADGVIDDPRRCNFDPASMRCSAGRSNATCLTEPQIDAVRKVYAAPRNSRGEIVYPAGTVVGSEGNWPNWVLPAPPATVTFSRRGAEEYLRYLAFERDPGPNYDFRSFDFDTQLGRLQAQSAVFDALSTDMRAFRDRGGKIILWHGWGDAAISPLMTIAYYDELLKFMGGDRATQAFARLFLLPGVHHCRGGNGAGLIDALAALEQWREQDRAPDVLIATRDDDLDGKIERTRPVYPYPARASYIGRGDWNDPKNYRPR